MLVLTHLNYSKFRQLNQYFGEKKLHKKTWLTLYFLNIY
nr:MAG TPA: hypothetical protein [Caudoviricetes sp.]